MTMAGLSGTSRAPGSGQFAATPVDRLVRKEVALGAIRERPYPQGHIGLAQIAPFLQVDTDDVIFDYIRGGLQEGLAPNRAEDAESELSQKDILTHGSGRASVTDWALKDEYSASDVTRYRDDLLIRQALEGAGVPLQMGFNGNTVADFQARVARDDARRRRALDNRLEWMIMQVIESGKIAYNDGKIKWTVDYARPANQQDQAPASGLYNGTSHDPIGDLLDLNEWMFTNYGFRFRKAITSQKVLNTFYKSDRFRALAGLVGGTPSSPIDPNYLIQGWGPQYAINAVEAATGIQFQVYDSIYRTRPVGSKTWVNQRFLSDNKIFFLPTEGDLGEVDDTAIGFAKTLTAPHPEGNWQSGYYEWEDESRDPWMTVRGSGIKAFPVYPYMEYTYSMTVL